MAGHLVGCPGSPCWPQQLIRARLETGRYASEDDLILAALQSLDECDAELQAIQEALDSLDGGEPGTELSEAFRKIRERHGVKEYCLVAPLCRWSSADV